MYNLFKIFVLTIAPSLFVVFSGISGLFVPSAVGLLLFGFLSSKQKGAIGSKNLSLLLIITLYTLVAFNNGLFLKPLFSCILLIIVIYFARRVRFGLDRLLFETRGRFLARSILVFIILFNLLVELDIPQYSKFNSPFVPFSEPSHFYLTFSLWILPFRGENRVGCLVFNLFIIATALFIESFLGLVLGLLSIFLLFPRWSIVSLVFFGVPFYSYMANTSYYGARVVLDQENLTAAVWLLGWHEVFANSLDSWFLGSGLQTLGFDGHSSVFAQELLMVYKEFESINLYDGGFLFVKIFSEFGLISLFFIVGVLNYFIINGYFGLTLAFIVDLFLRGTGYGSLPFVVGLIFYITRNQENV